MLTNLKLALVLVAASTLAACGGGANPTPRGAIAIDVNTGQGAITTFHTSQSKANSAALMQCPTSACVLVVEFSGDGTCGSGAMSLNGVWGAGVANTNEEADKRAIEQCASRGGNTCYIPNWVQNQCH